MTIVTMTTVGYREVHSLSPAGRVFNTFLIIAAVLSGGFLVATFTQADAVIHSGDRLIAIGSADHVSKLETLADS
jgi:Trk K+ transport system NAD-binding subunit